MNFKSVTLFFVVSIIFASQIESKWLAPHAAVFKKMIPVRGFVQLNNRVFTLDAEKGIKSTYVQKLASPVQEKVKEDVKPSAEPLNEEEPTTAESVSESNPIPVPSPVPSTTTTTTTTTTLAPSTLPSTTSTTTTTIATPVTPPRREISKTSFDHPSGTKGYSSGKTNQHHHHEQQQQQQQQHHHHQSSHQSSHHHQSSGKVLGKTSVKATVQSSFVSPAQKARSQQRKL